MSLLQSLIEISTSSQEIDGKLASRFVIFINQAKDGTITESRAKKQVRKLVHAYMNDEFPNKDILIETGTKFVNTKDISSW